MNRQESIDQEEYMEIVDLFMEHLEENKDTDELALRLAGSGMSRNTVHEAQTEASQIFSGQF